MHRRRLSSLFECAYCGRRFIRESQLDLHHELTAQRVKAHCAFCRSLADDPKALHLHALTHNKIRPYECHLCKRKFVSLLNLKSHNILHLAGRIPTYYFGPYRASVKEELQSSDDGEDSAASSDDEYDEYVMSDDHSLNKHLKFKIDWKIYSSDPLFKNAQIALDVLKILICQSCGKAVMSLYDNGLTLDEGLTAPTKCLGCQGDLVPWNGDLSCITSSIHLLESPPLECVSCNHVFPSMAKLKKHMQVHAETVCQAVESSGESSTSFDSWSTRLSCNSGLLVPSSSHSRKLDRLDSTSSSQAAKSKAEKPSSLNTTSALSLQSSPCFKGRNETTPKKILRVKLCRISLSSPEVQIQCVSAGDRAASSGNSSTERTSFARNLGRRKLRSSRGGGEDILQDSSQEQEELLPSITSSRSGRGRKRPWEGLRGKEPPVSIGLSTKSVEVSASGEEPSFIHIDEKRDSLCLSGGRDSVSSSGDGGSVRKLLAGARRVLPSGDLTDQICFKQSLTAPSNSAIPESNSASRLMRKRPGGSKRRRKRRFEVAQLGLASADADMIDPYHTLCNAFSTSSDSTRQKTSGKKSKQRQHSGGNSPELRVSLQKLHISPQEKELQVADLPIQKSKNQNPFSINGFSDSFSLRCETATGMLRAPQKLHVQASPRSVSSGQKTPGKPSKNSCLSASNGLDEAVTKENSSNPAAYQETFKGRDTPIHDLAETVQEKSTQTPPSSSSGKRTAIRRSKRAPQGLPWTWYDDREYAHTCRICGKTFLLLDRLLIHTASHQRSRQQQQ